MGQRFVGETYLSKNLSGGMGAVSLQNIVTNGGKEFWQRDPNWRVATGGGIVLYNSMTNAVLTFQTKQGLAATVPGGADAYAASGYVIVDNEIMQYTGFNSSTNTFTVSTRGVAVIDSTTGAGQIASAHSVVPGGAAASQSSPCGRPVWSAVGAYAADKWRIGTGTPATKLFVYRNSNPANVDASSESSMAFRWLGNGATGPGRLTQYIENYKGLRGRKVSVSGRILCATAGKVRTMLLAEVGGVLTTIATSPYNVASSIFQTLIIDQVQVPVGTTKLYVAWEFRQGADTTYNIQGYLDNVMFVAGAPQDYVEIDESWELLRCQRVYEKVYTAQFDNGAPSGGLVGSFVRYRVSKPAAPATIAITTKGSWTMNNLSGQGGSATKPRNSTDFGGFFMGGMEREGTLIYGVATSASNPSFYPNSVDDFIEIEVFEP